MYEVLEPVQITGTKGSLFVRWTYILKDSENAFFEKLIKSGSRGYFTLDPKDYKNYKKIISIIINDLCLESIEELIKKEDSVYYRCHNLVEKIEGEKSYHLEIKNQESIFYKKLIEYFSSLFISSNTTKK